LCRVPYADARAATALSWWLSSVREGVLPSELEVALRRPPQAVQAPCLREGCEVWGVGDKGRVGWGGA